MPAQREFGLSGNALKWIALVTMLVDHIGYILLPNLIELRIIGRIAFPIYAYLIAEGCRYTRRPWRHFWEVFVLGVICQIVNQIAAPNPSGMYMNILLTFSVSIVLCNGLLAIAATKWKVLAFSAMALLLWLVVLLLENLGIKFDYGFWGILLAPALILADKHWQKLLMAGVMLCCLSVGRSNVQWWSLLAVFPLSLYNGTRGSKKLKYFFYLFYPLHLAALYGIHWLINLLS